MVTLSRKPLALLLAFVLVASPALAAMQAPGDPGLASGILQVQEGEFDAAVTTLEGVSQRMFGANRMKEYARASLYLAVAYYALGQEQTAKARFADAWRADPGFEISAREFPPKFYRFLEQTRAAALATAAPRPSPTPRPMATPTPRSASTGGGGGSKKILIGVAALAVIGGGVAVAGGGGGGGTPDNGAATTTTLTVGGGTSTTVPGPPPDTTQPPGTPTTTTPGGPGPTTTTTQPGTPTTTTTTTTTQPGTPTTSTTTTTTTPTTTTPSTTTTTTAPGPTCQTDYAQPQWSTPRDGDTITGPRDLRCIPDSSIPAACIGSMAYSFQRQGSTTFIDQASSPYTVRWSPTSAQNGAVTLLCRVLSPGGSAISNFAPISVTVNVTTFAENAESRNAITWTSQLDVPGGEGQVVVDGTDSFFPAAGRATGSLAGGRPQRRLEAVLVNAAGPGTWRFALEGAVVPGSLRIIAGTVVAVSPTAVTFRLNGKPGERVMFTFRSGK